MAAVLNDLGWPTLGLLIGVAAVAGMARGFSGFGAALIFVPAASALAGPAIAAPVLLVADDVMALPFIPPAFRMADKRAVAVMASGALFGVPLGTYLLDHGDPLVLRWMIAATAAGLLALLVSGWRYHGAPRPAVTAMVGAVSGLFGGLAQLSGPPVVAYWLGGQGRHQDMRANIIVYFVATSILTTVSYGVAGLLTAKVLWLAAIVGPAYGAGLFFGSRLFGKASDVTFRRLSYALIALSVAISLPLWR